MIDNSNDSFSNSFYSNYYGNGESTVLDKKFYPYLDGSTTLEAGLSEISNKKRDVLQREDTISSLSQSTTFRYMLLSRLIFMICT